jgi:predicted metal-dependent TIM-barrel fold hydrolase
MQIIQPHYHGIARTAQDYERMAMSGVVAVAEPAFWAVAFRIDTRNGSRASRSIDPNRIAYIC